MVISFLCTDAKNMILYSIVVILLFMYELAIGGYHRLIIYKARLHKFATNSNLCLWNTASSVDEAQHALIEKVLKLSGIQAESRVADLSLHDFGQLAKVCEMTKEKVHVVCACLSSIQSARRSALEGNMVFSLGDGQIIPCQKDHLDTVIAWNPYLLGTTRSKLLEEACRALKSGGILIMVTVLGGKETMQDLRVQVEAIGFTITAEDITNVSLIPGIKRQISSLHYKDECHVLNKLVKAGTIITNCVVDKMVDQGWCSQHILKCVKK